MKFRIHFFSAVLLVMALVAPTITASGQADTVVQIQLATGTAKALAPRSVAAKAGTEPRKGSPGTNQLPTQPAGLNLMEGTAFTIPSIAENTVDAGAYPASTSIQLMVYKYSAASGQCSGTMVAPNLALTAAHCIIDPAKRMINGDEIVVAASGKNLVNGAALVTKVKSVYVMKDYLTNKSKEDIMLVELADPIGDHTGWMGMTFLTDTVFLNNSVFHKFSYPAKSYEPENSPGRKLHYNYGLIDVLDPEVLGVNSESAIATPGQSGSTLFFLENDLPRAVGVANYSKSYKHQRITERILDSFRPFVDEAVAQANNIPFIMYPNPMRQSAIVKVPTRMTRYTMTILNAAGEILKTQHGTDAEFVFIDKGTMPAGDYSFRLVDEKGRSTRGNFRVIE